MPLRLGSCFPPPTSSETYVGRWIVSGTHYGHTSGPLRDAWPLSSWAYTTQSYHRDVHLIDYLLEFMESKPLPIALHPSSLAMSGDSFQPVRTLYSSSTHGLVHYHRQTTVHTYYPTLEALFQASRKGEATSYTISPRRLDCYDLSGKQRLML